MILTLTTCVLLSAPIPETSSDLETKREQAKGIVLSLLRDKTSWTPDKAEQLLSVLKYAGDLRVVDAAPLLVEHLDYRLPDKTIGPEPIETMFPAVGALTRLGMPAVPALITYLKQTDPGTLDEVGKRKYKLVGYCLSELYHDKREPGWGMARARIEAEIRQATAAEKANLQKAIEHPAFHNPEARK